MPSKIVVIPNILFLLSSNDCNKVRLDSFKFLIAQKSKLEKNGLFFIKFKFNNFLHIITQADR